MKKIITITVNPALDKSTQIDRINPDQKLRCQRARFEPGGGGINVSRAIQKLGGESLALHASGGPIGTMFCDLLEQESIQHQQIAIQGNTRVSFTALEKSSNQQYRFIMPGPELQEAEWRALLEAIEAAGTDSALIVASGSLPPGVPTDFYAQLARRLQGSDHRLIVDTSGDELRAAAKAGVYLLKPNMRELKHLAGEPIENEDQLKRAAARLIEQDQAQVVIVSMGAGGALLASKEGFEHIRAPTIQIRSKIGAGDSMVAGITLALARGKPLGKAARFGVAAGASAVATPGTELCRKDKTEQLFEQMMERTSSSQPEKGK